MRHLLAYISVFIIISAVVSCSGDEAEFVYEPGNYMPDTSGRYGVRWSLTDANDLGERCFSACNKTARIGIGQQDGYSDFDTIYPWSELQLCNIGGDTFVRIPKFCVERYQDGGYEYRIISREGTLHPAFIEDGRELDAIYVGAYEGYCDGGKLYSKPDVIPSSNYSPQDFLDMAQNRGENYTLYDMRTVDLIFTLFAVEYGCRNSGVVLGYGIAQYQQPLEAEYSGTDVFYSKEKANGVNAFRTKYRGNEQRISVGSNICICKASQDSVLTFAKVLSIESNKKRGETVYYFDGDPIDVDTDCFIGSCAQTTNWTETCSAPLAWHTGRADMRDGYDADKRNPMRYRWIENVVGNLWHYLPDVTFVDNRMFVCANMKDYAMHKHEAPYAEVNYSFPLNEDNGTQKDKRGSNFWITSLYCDNDYSYVSFGNDFDSQLLSNQAFGAYYYLREGVNIIANGGGFDHEFRCNLLTNRAWIYPGRRWFLYGARLIYKPLNAEIGE